jgi:hypothetical protein
MPIKDNATTVQSDITYASGGALDTRGYMSATFVLATINTTAVALTESDDNSTYTDVAATNIIKGDGVAGAIAGNDVTYTAAGTGRIGYVGKKRYVKATVTNAATDTTIVSELGGPLYAPVN